jgi:hypothetical protein
MRNSVFDALNVTIHCFDHLFKVSKSWFNLQKDVAGLTISSISEVSSANSLILQFII